jgi:hypothetical protein
MNRIHKRTCSPSTERRVRTILTWGAGDCGLIGDRPLDYLADMLIGGELSDVDLHRLARPAIYSAVMSRAAALEEFRFVQRLRDAAANAQGAARGRSGIR